MSFPIRTTVSVIDKTTPIDTVINRFSDLLTNTAFCAAVGFLGTHLVKQLNASLMADPRVGFVCGAATGMITGLFLTDQANTSSKVVGVAALIFIPIRFCKRLNLPTTFQATLLTTAATLGSVYLIALLFTKINDAITKKELKPYFKSYFGF